MPNLNKVFLMARLTRDPELRQTQNNTAVANLGLAVNRRWKDKQGEQQEETTFIDAEAWGRTAEVLSQYLSKGRPVYLEGRLGLDRWQDQSGNNRSKLKVVVESFQFIDSKGGTPGGGSGGGEQNASTSGQVATNRNTPDSGNYGKPPSQGHVSADYTQPLPESGPHDENMPF